jgi:mannosylglycerate hydrolase
MTTRRRVDIVPHTHWDREWYDPFQTFRLRLVDLVDGLLDLMERDPSYAHFLFDGQMAAVDDYLEVRPEHEERLRRLAAARRIECGPWYILLDEFLVSGETIVRDLQLGIERAAAFGGAMDVGYLPDMFGHVAQMPQILAQAGLATAVVWRGVPSAVDKSSFWWIAPDGSRVRTQYLVTGYSEGASIADDAKQLVRRLDAYVEQYGKLLVGPVLLMNGTDHQEPQPWLGRVVAEANGIQDRYEVAVSSLAEALAGATTEGIPEWSGELRSGARANLLMGVASNHVDVKQAAARAERALERFAEPLAALALPRHRYPSRALDLAWRELVRNAAHDSICACSHDEVAAAVLHRFAEARQIADGVAARALAELGRSFAAAGPVAVNTSGRSRSGMVEIVLEGTGEVEGAQPVGASEGLDLQLVLSPSEMRAIVEGFDGDQVSADAYVTGVEVHEVDEDPIALEVTVHVGPDRRKDLQVDEIKRDLMARLSLRPEGRVRVRLAHSASRRLLVRTTDVPGLGWKRLAPAPLDHPVAAATADDGTIRLDNGLVTVEVDPGDGTFALSGEGFARLAGFNRLVDSGDHGDTYNYSPPEHDVVVDTPSRTGISLREGGPVRAVVDVVRTYSWPAGLDEVAGARSAETREVVVRGTVELRAGEHLVRVSSAFENPCRDHRLRAWFPLPDPADRSRAECAFAVVERGLHAEGGPSERALATYPCRRFVQAGGLTVCQDGLLEYELVDLAGEGGAERAHGLALTLLRATGVLSRLTMLNRPLPAGPNNPLRTSQMLGPLETRYAVAVTGDAGPAAGYSLAEDAFVPLSVVPSFGGGERPAEGSFLTITGAEISAVRRSAGALEVRIFNPGSETAQVTVEVAGTAAAGDLVDLRGRQVGTFLGGLALAPWRIATLHLDA